MNGLTILCGRGGIFWLYRCGEPMAVWGWPAIVFLTRCLNSTSVTLHEANWIADHKKEWQALPYGETWPKEKE